MKKRTWLTIAIATAAVAAIWALSLLLTGHQEAWDAGGGYYPIGLVVAGMLAGMLAPKPLWALHRRRIRPARLYADLPADRTADRCRDHHPAHRLDAVPACCRGRRLPQDTLCTSTTRRRNLEDGHGIPHRASTSGLNEPI
jgi:hypothetical protein